MEKPILLQQQKQPTPIQPQSISPSTASPQVKPQQSKHVLFDLTQIEVETEEIEGRTQRCYTTVKQMIAGKSANECQDVYQKYIAANPQQNVEELTMGLLVVILVEPDGQNDFYKDVVAISKDNLALFSNYLNMIIIERITRISQHSIKQVFWVVNQLIKNGVASAENTCSNLIRQTAKGDLSAKNLFMVENLLDMLIANRAWLINSTSFMGPTVIYNVTRLIIDHLPVAYNVIRQKEIDFVIGLIREKFEFVLSIGKDFLRLLNSLQRVAGFHQLFQDIYINDPKELHPTYEGAKQLFSLRTPRRLFQSCLTFDMERKISYLATQVRFGNQKRYQDWFHKQYLAGTESSWLRSDLIRYICTIIHPSNEVLCSDIIPRWAIIGWLLTTVNHVVVQCGPALFFDWFAFDPKSDNIMNIEPAILVMYYSLRSHPQVTALLLDYLCRAPTGFSWKLQDIVRISIKKSLQQILEKRVLPSLTPVFVNPKYDSGLKARIKEHFPEYCQVDNGVAQPNSDTPSASQTQCLPGTASSTNQTGSTTVSEASNNPEALKQGDVIIIEDNPFNETTQTPVTQDAAATNQDNDSNSSVPSLGFHPPMKIHMPSSYSTSKTTCNAKTTSGAVETKTQPGLNRNGTDPVEALIGVGSSSAPQIAKEGPGSVPSPVTRKASISSVIKQEDLSEDSASMLIKRTTHATPSNSSDRVSYGVESPSVQNGNSSDLQLDTIDNSGINQLSNLSEHHSSIKVIYPFMTVKKVLQDAIIDSLGSELNDHLNYLRKSMNPDVRVSHTHSLMDLLTDEQSTDEEFMDNLGCHFANLISDDFGERIPVYNREACTDTKLSYKRIHEISPLFAVCHHLIENDSPKPVYKTFFATIAKYYEAATFLLLYYLRVCQVYGNMNAANYGIPRLYLSICEACDRDNPTKSLVQDMKNMLTYDSEMFCCMLPLIFSDFSHTEPYNVINNCELIRLVASSIDPLNLHDFLCLCLTGSTKIISREEPLKVIETSLTWESWEQYFFWKILTAQSVPIENYISILPKLNAKRHPEAMSSILSNLQKITEPDAGILQAVIDTYTRQNEPFVSAIIRYWSIRSDLNKLTKVLIKLSPDSRPTSPQVKRKGQPRTAANKGASSSSSSSPSSSSMTLSPRSEKLLLILDSIKRRAPRNKLLAQVELLDNLSQLEPLCNDSLRPKLNALLQARQRPAKKKKVDKD